MISFYPSMHACVAKLAELVDLDEEKPYSMMGLGPSWSHKELALLVLNRHDLSKAAEILGRTEEACRLKLYRLGLAMGVNLKKASPQIMLVFPREQIESRKAVIKQVQPRLKKLLDKIDKSDELAPETVNDLAKVVRALAALLTALEKWQTGEEMLQIWAHEVEEEDDDQPGF